MTPLKPNEPTHLLELPFVGRFLKSPSLLLGVRLALLGLLLGMIVAGWHRHGIAGLDVPDPLMYTHVTTHSFWVLWLMGSAILAVLAGRLWCGLCPLGWVNELMARRGFRYRLPVFLKNRVPVTLVLILLQWLVFAAAVHRYPDYTAWLLGAALVLALVTGIFFSGRSFCHLFCPAGTLFGLYALGARLKIRPKASQLCSQCTEQHCVSTSQLWRTLQLGQLRVQWASRLPGCPADTAPAQLDVTACHLCLNCVRNCCKSNVSLALDRNSGPGVPSWSLSFFYLVVVGLLVLNVIKVFIPLREALLRPPIWLGEAAGFSAAGTEALLVFWVGVLLPLGFFLPPMILDRLGSMGGISLQQHDRPAPSAQVPPRSAEGWWQSFARFVVPTLPVVIGAHLMLALVKLNAKLGYLPGVLSDPLGSRSYLAYHVYELLPPPGVLIPLEWLRWILASLLLLCFLLSVRLTWRRALERPAPKLFFAGCFTSVVLLTGISGATLFQWLFLR